MLSFFPLIGMTVFLGRCHGINRESIVIPRPHSGAEYVPRDLQSFSIEFAFFPDYAGNKSHPNNFSKNLLENLRTSLGYIHLSELGELLSEFPSQLHGFLTSRLIIIMTEIIRTTFPNRRITSSLYTSIQMMINLSKSIMVQHSLNLTIHLVQSSFCTA
jgi:hypothetical protein